MKYYKEYKPIYLIIIVSILIVFNACSEDSVTLSFVKNCNKLATTLSQKVEHIEKKLEIIQSNVEKKLNTSPQHLEMMKNIHARLSNLEKKFNNTPQHLEKNLESIQSRLTYLEKVLDDNSQDSYVKVITDELNIRSEAIVLDKTLIAKAQKGAYLRVIKNINPKWNLIEFVIDGFYYQGYASSQKNHVEVKYLDPITFSKLNKRGLIKYHWVFEIYQIMKKKNYTELGIGIKAPKTINTRFLGFLYKSFKEYDISIEPVRYYETHEISRIEPLCATKKLNAFLNIKIILDKQDSLSGKLDIFLIDNNSKIIDYIPMSIKSLIMN